MIADHLVRVFQNGRSEGKLVELETSSVRLSAISMIAHLGDDLLNFRYAGQDIDQYVPATQIRSMRVRAKEHGE